MFNRRNVLVASLAALAAGLSRGADSLVEAAVARNNFAQAFSQRYGNNPRSLNGNSNRNSRAAQQKRAAVKRRNIAKHPRSTLGRKRRA
ncbi:DNA primase [Xanthomonas phage Pfeifenkraut]|uniref:DNA primase n=1 Tax=Xanthomonas phage Pfeifenkraut TaxID=2939132 RepID=A0A9E7E136_9CAUD|nr:DNA primase [Xanthomonas phage Pfeifenkraut]URA06936.1 DNA primase [Xanthomonas phage Pfeifenkraut]